MMAGTGILPTGYPWNEYQLTSKVIELEERIKKLEAIIEVRVNHER